MHTMKRLLLASVLAAVPALALAQGAPPAGGPPPGGAGGPPPGGGGGVGAAMAQVKDSPEETAAKATLEGWGALLDQGKVDEAFEKYVSKDFVDHSEMARVMAKTPNLGYDKVRSLFKMMLGQPSAKKMVVKISADDDMVTVQGRLGQDIFRVKDGKITDHWDTIGGFEGPSSGAPAQ